MPNTDMDSFNNVVVSVIQDYATKKTIVHCSKTWFDKEVQQAIVKKRVNSKS